MGLFKKSQDEWLSEEDKKEIRSWHGTSKLYVEPQDEIMDTMIVRVRRSDILKAESLYNERKIDIIYILNKPYYIEVSNQIYEFELRVWPTNMGYSGRQDGWILYASSLLSLMTSYTSLILEDMQKEYANYSIVTKIEEDVQDRV
jgi:hypothetical protein